MEGSFCLSPAVPAPAAPVPAAPAPAPPAEPAAAPAPEPAPERRRALPPSLGGPKRRRLLPPSVGGAPRPTLCFRGRLIYARSARGVEDACREMRGASALGFDIEWRVTFERGRAPNPVAVLQLATSDSAFVIQLCALGGAIPACLVDLLADPSVALVGVGARGDARRLEHDYPATIGARGAAGVVDLGELAWARLGVRAPGSLSAMSEHFCGRALDKAQAVRCSNWEQELSAEQLDYAATDAWAGLRVYEAIMRAPAAPPPPPPPCRGRALADSTNRRAAEPVAELAKTDELPPSKRAVLDLLQAGRSPAEIASVRSVQESTVLSYLGDAIEAGHAYDWSRFEIPLETEQLVRRAAATVAAAKEGEGAADQAPVSLLRDVRNACCEEVSYGVVRCVVAHAARTGLAAGGQGTAP